MRRFGEMMRALIKDFEDSDEDRDEVSENASENDHDEINECTSEEDHETNECASDSTSDSASEDNDSASESADEYTIYVEKYDVASSVCIGAGIGSFLGTLAAGFLLIVAYHKTQY